MNKKHIFIWSLYDFANSFVFITFLIYFSKWLVVTKGLSDWWYNATYIIGSLGLMFFAPYLGQKADMFGSGRKYLIVSTFGCLTFYAGAIVAAIASYPLVATAVLFGFGNFFYQLSFVFYNPLLYHIAPSNHYGKVSGFASLSGYMGQICGVLMSIPFVSGAITFGFLGLPSVDPLIAPLIPSVAVFFLLSLPLLFSPHLFIPNDSSDGPATTVRGSFDKLMSVAGVASFLLAFFLFSDAITTIINNFSIFTSNIFTITNDQISILTLLILGMSGVGAFMAGLLSDKIGARKTLKIMLISWIVIIPVVALIKSYPVYAVAVTLAGLCVGGTFSVSRQLLVSIVPKHLLHYAFGLYAISERASTFAGPLLWSAVLYYGGGYRNAMMSMVIFQIASVMLIRERKKRVEKEA